MFSFPLPLLNRPILWYGFFFALGFFLAYFVLRFMLKRSEELRVSGKEGAERITGAVLLFGVLGARLADLLFYQHISVWLKDPLLLFKFWEGGLASHGGAAGILLALLWLSTGRRKAQLGLSFRQLLDAVVIPTALAGACIRIGNFFNQEILGTPTTMPWGVLFLHPADGSAPVVRHPAQLYESVFYFALFATLFWLWNRAPKMRAQGRLSALFLMLLFGFRLLIEAIKEEQSVYLLSGASWTMGQMLSLPFFALGALLFYLSLKERRGDERHSA